MYELIAPAGDFPSLIAAVEAGADAVYFGLKKYNLRDNAGNFTLSDLNEINKICLNVKKYLTLNSIIFDEEIEEIEEIIKKVKGKIDAVICWDFAVIELCRKHGIPFHISTQASVSNKKTASFYKKLGAKRIVMARELNLKQIKEISKIVDVECFVHGAMCVSISGRCFTSQFLHGLSANRGKCAHPCRRAYFVFDEEGNELKLENNRVMSAKDLCTLPFIEKMKEAGIKAFKIEGRNRGPEYVSTVVKVYKEALTKKLTACEISEKLNELKKVYNRGFSSGFYIKMPTSDDFSRTENGEAKEKKVYAGKVIHFWPKISVAAVHLFGNSLKIGDEIYIIGNKTGVKRVKINTMEIEHKKVKIAEKGSLVGVKLPYCRKGDEIYLIKSSD